MTNELKRNIRLGIFVLLGLALFLAAIIYVGSDKAMFQSTFELKTEFNDAQGLNKGANIWLRGIKVGIVSGVGIERDSVVVITMKIKADYQSNIKEDAVAQISKQGVLGDPVIIIYPGKAASQVEDGQLVTSQNDTDLIASLRNSAQNLESITANVQRITSQIKEGEGFLGELVYDTALKEQINQALVNFELTGRRTATLAGNVSTYFSGVVANKESSINVLLTDTTFSDVFLETMGNLKVTSENTAEITGDFTQLYEQLEKRMDDSTNALGLILTDSSFAATLEQSAERLNEDLRAAQSNFLLRGYFKKKKKREEKEGK